MANLNSSIINGFLKITGKLRAKSLSVESNELVENLNADLLDGKQGSEYASSQELSGLTEQVEKNTEDITTNAQNIQSTTEVANANKGDIENLTTQVGTNTNDISTLNTLTSGLSTDLSNLTTQVNTNTGNILTNMENISKNTEAIGTNKDDIDKLKSRVKTVEDSTGTLSNDVSGLKTKTDATNTNLGNLTTRVGTTESDIDALETKTDTTNTNVSNLSSQVSTNATNIQTNANDISGLKTKTDTTNNNVKANTDNIAKILAGTATIPSVANAAEADDAKKLGGQLPSYYATAASLEDYLPLTGGTITGKVKILGTAANDVFQVRAIAGTTPDGTAASPLYLNYNNQQPVYINGENLVYHSGNIPSASTSQKGIVQLNNTRTSTSTTQAATANALKSAYDTVDGALTSHKNDTNIHLSETDRAILTKANKFKGYYETETALTNAHPTGEAGDYAIVNSTDTMWIWDADKEGGAGWKDGAGKGSVVSVNNMTGEVVLTKSSIGLGNVDNTSDANKPISTATQTALNLKQDKTDSSLTTTSKTVVGAINELDTEVGTNTSNISTIMGDYIKSTDYATNSNSGVVKQGNGFRVNSTNGTAYADGYTRDEYSSKNTGTFISKGTLENIKENYVKEGITGNTITLTDVEKAAARTWLGAASQTDVNGKVSKTGDTMTGELQINALPQGKGQIQLCGTNTEKYGAMIRNDGDNTYILLTNKGDMSGNYNALRPFRIINSTGGVVVGNGFKSEATADSTSTTTGSITSSGGIGIAKAANIGTYMKAGTYVEATTDLKTGSGKVNFNDKVKVEYNATNECLEFNFS